MPRPQTAGAGTALAVTDTSRQSIGGRSVPPAVGAVNPLELATDLSFCCEILGIDRMFFLRPCGAIRYPARTDARLERERDLRHGVGRPDRPVRRAAQALAGFRLPAPPD